MLVTIGGDAFMTRKGSTVSYDDMMVAEFRRRPSFALGYLNEALKNAFEEDEPRLALVALANVSRALGMTRVAKETGLQRESLHRMLSKRGNPEWNSIFRVIRALGLRPKFERVKAPRRRTQVGAAA
jgi:probable addiction module antidote protein